MASTTVFPVDTGNGNDLSNADSISITNVTSSNSIAGVAGNSSPTSAAKSLHRQRLQQFADFLEHGNNVRVNELRKFCFDFGIPDDNSHFRSLAWKILLGYIGNDKNEWDGQLKKKRHIYEQFIGELVINEQANTQTDDHPLNPAPTSHWNQHFKDNEILSQIFKDVRRLYPDISFFQRKIKKRPEMCIPGRSCDIIGRHTTSSMKSSEIVKNFLGINKVKDGNDMCKYVNEVDDGANHGELIVRDNTDEEFHWQVVARILFIYAKLNPGQSYVQGMNEIIGPIYYVFANDNKSEWAEHCEVDTFWCFTELMSEIRDLYNSQLDTDQSSGVVSMMGKLSSLLALEDPPLYSQLNQHLNIKPHYYAFRWITLLLSQEFPLPEVIHIWDFLFADEFRFSFLIKTCCAMLLLLQSELMNGDFASNMKLLQNFPERIDVSTVISRAKRINRIIK